MPSLLSLLLSRVALSTRVKRLTRIKMDIAFIWETLQVIAMMTRSSGSSKTAIVVKDLKSQMDFHLTIELIEITAVETTL